MALDGTLLLAVKQELTPFVGGRVDKIYQPSRDELVIGMRVFAEGQNRQGKIFFAVRSSPLTPVHSSGRLGHFTKSITSRAAAMNNSEKANSGYILPIILSIGSIVAIK